MLAQLKEELVGDQRGGLGEGDRVVECELLDLTEGVALAMAAEIDQLLLGYACGSAPGRVDVDSRGAADPHGDTQVGEPLEPRR